MAKAFMLKCSVFWPVTFVINRRPWPCHFSSQALWTPGVWVRGLVVFVLSLCQTMIHCHLTRENKAEKWGISGPKGLFLQHSGLHYNIQKKGRDSCFCSEYCCSRTSLYSNKRNRIQSYWMYLYTICYSNYRQDSHIFNYSCTRWSMHCPYQALPPCLSCTIHFPSWHKIWCSTRGDANRKKSMWFGFMCFSGNKFFSQAWFSVYIATIWIKYNCSICQAQRCVHVLRLSRGKRHITTQLYYYWMFLTKRLSFQHIDIFTELNN